MQRSYLALDFPPASRLIGKPVRELLTAATLAHLAPEQLTDAVFDRRKD